MLKHKRAKTLIFIYGEIIPYCAHRRVLTQVSSQKISLWLSLINPGHPIVIFIRI